MSEKPARRVDTRDGSATELSITTKIFLRSGSVTREGVFKRFDQGHLKVRIHIRERRLIEEVEVHGLMRGGEGRYRSASGSRQSVLIRGLREIINSLGRGSCHGMHASRERDSAIRT